MAMAGAATAAGILASSAYADVYNIPAGDVTALATAINDANASAGPHTINLTASTYNLTGALPTITVAGLTINGNGATISGGGAHQIFTIGFGAEVEVNALSMTQGFDITAGGAIHNSGDLALIACVITSSHAGANGGGVFNAGTLVVADCTMSGNTSDDGGAIFNAGGSVLVSGGELSGNSGISTGGGAIYNNFGDVTITDGAMLIGNDAAQGGAIVNDGDLSITSSTLHGNTCEGLGGGILTFSGTVMIEASTISHNTADVAGGGIAHFDGTIGVLNSTLSGNAAGLLFGGGLVTFASVDMLHATIVLNAAGDSGGGISNLGADVTFANTIVAANTVGGSPDDIAGAVTGAFSLIGNAATSGGLTDGVAGNIVGVNPAMVFDFSLANNGGPTQTHALLCGGEAIDAGDPLLVEFIPYDQRGAGFARISGCSVDIGAYEFQQNIAFQGLGIGFWKTRAGNSYWLETAYNKTDLVGAAFGPGYPGAYGGSTLLQALNFPGGPGALGAERILLRQAVAAILNASHPNICYPLSISQIVQMVQAAVGSGDEAVMHALEDTLEGYNNLGL